MYLFRTVFWVVALCLASAQAQPLVVTTVAGKFGEPGAADGLGAAARFAAPSGVAVDGAGNVFVADRGNSSIRKITPAGVVTTVAGASGANIHVDGTDGAARFVTLGGLVIDQSGVLYIADRTTIRRMSPTGAVTTLAGRPGVSGDQDGTGSAATFHLPQGLALDAAGNLYVAEPFNGTVRRVTPAGVVTTIYRDDPSLAGQPRRSPQDVAFDRASNLYFTDTRYAVVCRMTPAGSVTEYVGNRDQTTVDGWIGSFKWPAGLVSDGAGNLFVTDEGTIRLITPDRFVRTVAGVPGMFISRDGTGSWARFGGAGAIARSAAGVLFIATTHEIRKATLGSPAGEVLTPVGSLWGMGVGAYGQLGDGTAFARDVPVQISESVIGMSAGHAHSLYVQSGGFLWAMGDNSSGQLGAGDPQGQRVPYPVTRDVRAVVAGSYHSLLLKTDRTLWAMGSNIQGQLGDGTTTKRASPVRVATGVTAMAASQYHSLFLREDGSLWGMGRNGENQLESGATTDRTSPIRIASDVVAMAAGVFHTVFVKTDGTLWAMGGNRWGQLGDHSSIDRATPVQIASRVKAVAAGTQHTMFLKIDGTLWTTGDDRTGQLGDGKSATTHRLEPLQIASGVVEIAAGGDAGLYVKNDGSAWAMGRHGTLGDQHVPVRIATGVAKIAQGTNHSLFLAAAPPPEAINPGRLINLSVLAPITTEGDSFVLGYVISGATLANAKPVVVRAAGPSLGALGYAGAHADPRLELYAGGTKIAENDNWGGAPATATDMAAVGAFAYAGPASRDAALAVDITTRDNSVRVSSGANVSGGTGTVIAEVYDATPAARFTATTPRLVNLSVLKNIGTSVTLGFVLGGGTSKTILIRAVGPTLGGAPFNLTGAMADPRLELFDGGGRSLSTNDNWGGDAALATAFGQTGAFPLPATSRDAALVVTLAPGSYTAVASPTPGTAIGAAILEVYEVP